MGYINTLPYIVFAGPPGPQVPRGATEAKNAQGATEAKSAQGSKGDPGTG